MRIKSGDKVKIIAGKEGLKGVTGKVTSIMKKKQRVVVENCPTHKKHLKPERSRKHPEGGIIEKPISVHISNVMLVPEGSDRPFRLGAEFRDGKKVRIARGKSAEKEVV